LSSIDSSYCFLFVIFFIKIMNFNVFFTTYFKVGNLFNNNFFVTGEQ
jgi:hypothetical protein